MNAAQVRQGDAAVTFYTSNATCSISRSTESLSSFSFISMIIVKQGTCNRISNSATFGGYKITSNNSVGNIQFCADISKSPKKLLPSPKKVYNCSLLKSPFSVPNLIILHFTFQPIFTFTLNCSIIL
jgi:hypothetical protein